MTPIKPPTTKGLGKTERAVVNLLREGKELQVNIVRDCVTALANAYVTTWDGERIAAFDAYIIESLIRKKVLQLQSVVVNLKTTTRATYTLNPKLDAQH